MAFSVKIKESSFELSNKQKVQFKDTGKAVRLDEAAEGADFLIENVKGYVILDIHNDKSDNPDYQNYIIVDGMDNKYVTGSPSFWESFINIFDEMKDDDSEWGLVVYKRDSKNYKGKQFLSCSIV